jgi:hypothetical protein
MGSLRKRKGSNVWQAQYCVPDPETGGLKQVRKPAFLKIGMAHRVPVSEIQFMRTLSD